MSDQHAEALPQRLKAATRELHARAERSGVMAELLAGTVSRGAYIALLANLQALYGALETAFGHATGERPNLAALSRSAALAADLHRFGASAPAPAPATLDYAARLHALRDAGAHRLWAHAYVRYLGDLHGGQILSRMVRQRFAPVDATRFYDFGDDAQVRLLREGLRTQLAALRLDAAQTGEVVAEAVWAFEAHCRIFEQIQARN